MAHAIAVLFERLLPEVLEPLLAEALGEGIRRSGDQGLHRVSASGRFSGAQTADLLAFCRSQELDGALVVADADVRRVLYFRRGDVVGADSDQLFERLGRILHREHVLEKEDADAVVEIEETKGAPAAAASLPTEALRFALEKRIWEVAASLYFMRHAHFVIVEGTPELGGLPFFQLPAERLAMEGMRRYDEWRHGSEAPKLAPLPPPSIPGVGTARPSPAAARFTAS
jgi:hypothetical protein